MEVKCLRLDDDARGIVKVDGKVTFVPNLLPGEMADIRIVKSKSKYNEGAVVSFKTKSTERVIPRCPYMNCGCTLSHLNYKAELIYKEEKVRNIIRKFTGEDIKVNPIIYDNHILGYRNKITLKVQNALGYYNYMTTNFFPIRKCLLVSKQVNDLIDIINREDLSKVREIIIKDMDEIMAIIKGCMDIKNIIPKVSSIYLNDKLVYGTQYIKTRLNNLVFNIKKDSFFQVNRYMTEKLYNEAIKKITKGKNTVALDLYCGTGTISLLLAPYFKKVIGIEINKAAIDCANKNKRENKIDNVQFICEDATKAIKGISGIDSLVVDPPRSGLTKEGIEGIKRILPSEIVYISCNPITLARDLNLLKEKYRIEEITPVEMFPSTHHIECICLMKIKKGKRKNII